jgi:hypothetical protein
MRKIIAVLAAFALLMPLSAFSAVSISKAKLGKGVVDREISEEASSFAMDETGYLWMRVVGGEGETITVNWTNGDQSFDVDLNIGSDSWRTWSSKVLYLSGEWTVTVTDSAGETLHQAALTVQ